MRFPFLLNHARRLMFNTVKRPPDFVIGNPDGPYMRRWWVIPRNKFFNVYLHHFMHSDDDRALHDHPWLFNFSYLVEGSYVEHTIDAGGINKHTRYYESDIKFRGWRAAHRVELINLQPCWTLFITGPVVRRWGFHCPKGWVHWKKFTQDIPGGSIKGAGCGELE